MASVIGLVHSGIGWFFELLFFFMQWMPPILSLTVFAILTGIVFLWIYPLISNQGAIKSYRDQISANLLAVRLFQNDLGVFIRIQGSILYNLMHYMRCSLIPLMIMLVPILLILTQMNRFYSVQPVALGDTILLRVLVEDAQVIPPRSEMHLEAPGFEIETPALVFASANEIAWRLRAEESGIHTAILSLGNTSIDKRLQAGDYEGSVSERRSAIWWEALLYPGEATLSEENLRSIRVTYEPLPLSVFGLPMNWVVWFTLVTLVAGFALKGRFGVEI